ncbi:MAG: twin transmembrane helix small protein [Pseudomonadales bacterium]|uniref:Multipass membrane protein n=1 Tax=Oleiphilus messinensis TaxID=141451 RepID=A0A1Y0IAK2_9GAMM|nr:twin transmembrane helix small protein [Oleiphilus messinensis]ARU57280.1 multipass membrane protein [Oleiphilus messinensis]MCG8610143.1 twin transmembrane helix small protein [Pseudomonadales bacterium]
MLKFTIVLLLIAIVVSLFSGLVFLVKDDGKSHRTVNSLIVRVSLAILLVAVIAYALWTGQLHMNPTPS